MTSKSWTSVRLTTLLLLLIALALLYRYERSVTDPDRSTRSVPVLALLDGDTLLLDLNANGHPDRPEEEIRLLGVDTRMSQEAARFARQLLDGATVRLEMADGQKDILDRPLARVYFSQGDKTVFLNEHLIRLGYGRFRPPDGKPLDEPTRAAFISAQTEARQAGRGPAWRTDPPAAKDAPFQLPTNGELSVERPVLGVIDGDTIIVDLNENGKRDGKEEEIRLLGVDADELGGPNRPAALKATRFVQRLVEGTRVRLSAGKSLEDKYHRTLAFVHLTDGKGLLSDAIIRQGYARFYHRFANDLPPAIRRDLIAAEQEARAAKRGPVWEGKRR